MVIHIWFLYDTFDLILRLYNSSCRRMYLCSVFIATDQIYDFNQDDMNIFLELIKVRLLDKLQNYFRYDNDGNILKTPIDLYEILQVIGHWQRELLNIQLRNVSDIIFDISVKGSIR